MRVSSIRALHALATSSILCLLSCSGHPPKSERASSESSSKQSDSLSPSSTRPRFANNKFYVRDFSYKMDIGYVAFDPTNTDANEARFAVGFDQGEMRVYNFNLTTMKPTNKSFHSRKAGVTFLTYSPDGILIAAGDEQGGIQIWDHSSEEQMTPWKVFTGHRSEIRFLTFNHDGSQLMSLSPNSGQLRVWDVHSGRELHASDEKQVGLGMQYGLKLTASSYLIAPKLSQGSTVFSNGSELPEFVAEFDQDRFVKQDSEMLAQTASKLFEKTVNETTPNTVSFWDSTLPNEVQALTDRTVAAGVSPHRSILVTSKAGDLFLWDLTSRKQLHEIKCGAERPFHFVAVSPVGDFATTFIDRKHLQLWRLPSVASPDLLRTFYFETPLHAIAISPDEIVAAVGNDTGVIRWPFNYPRKMYDTPKGYSPPNQVRTTQPVTSVAFTQNVNEVVFGTGDLQGNMNYLKVQRLALVLPKPYIGLRKYTDHHDVISSAVAFRDLEHFLSACRDGKVRIWKTATGELEHEMDFESPVNDVELSKDESQLLVASNDGKIHIIDVHHWEERVEFLAHSKPILDVDWSPEERFFSAASADNTISVWNSETLEKIAICRGHEDQVNAVKTLDWGRQVVSGSSDRTVRLWDVARAEEIAVWYGHQASVTGLEVHRKNSQAISCSLDGTVRLWDLSATIGSDGASDE